VGDSLGAEAATGYIFGTPELVPQVELILADARERGDERLEVLAERFLRRAGVADGADGADRADGADGADGART
jgi:hypothetical protein